MSVWSRVRSWRGRLYLRCAVLLPLLLCIPLHAEDVKRPVIGAKKGKVYHIYPEECASARRIRPDHRVVFDSEEAAQRAGRRLCRRCEQLREKKQQEAQETRSPGARGGKSRRDSGTHSAGDGSVGQKNDEQSLVSSSSAPIYAVVKHVLSDGTLELDIGEKVCLAGVVCPAAGHPLADDAVRFIIEQTRGRKVRLTLPVSLESRGGRDVFGRLRAYVVPGEDGRDLGGELIFQGYAWVCRDKMCRRHEEYIRREDEAWRGRRGIWKPLEGAAGRREVVTGRHAKHYFAPDSPYVARLFGAFTLTLNEAKSRRLPPYPGDDAIDGSKERSTRKDACTKEISKDETFKAAVTAAKCNSPL